MQRAIAETERRRAIQLAYNQQHGIVPASIVKQVRDLTDRVKAQQALDAQATSAAAAPARAPQELSCAELDKLIRELEREMKQAAKDLAFERAAALRDQIIELRKILVLKNDPKDPIALAAADVFDE